MTRTTRDAMGTKAGCNHGQVRIAAIIDEAVFAELKAIAISNERTIAAEIRLRLNKSLEARA